MIADERTIAGRVVPGRPPESTRREVRRVEAGDDAPSAMIVRAVTTTEAFAQLRTDWDALAQRADPRSVFLSHDWFDAAWQWRRLSSSLYILACWSDGELVGVLPLVRPHAPLRGGGRALEFLAVPDTQVCDLIVLPARRLEAVAALVAELVRRQREWDVLRLHYLPPASVAATSMAAALTTHGVLCRSSEVATNLAVALDSTWEAYYATRSRRLKKSVNLVANRLEKSGRVTITWREPQAVAAGDVDAIVAEITDVSARSWKTETGNSLDNPGPQAFIRRLSQHGAARGWLSVWSLRLDDRLLAMEYQVIADGNVYALRSDFDAACEQISPGSHLSRQLLENLFGRGLDRYFMGPGSNAYKLRWTEGGQPVHEMQAFGTSLTGRASAAWELAMKPMLRRARDRVRAMRNAASVAPASSPHDD